MENQDFLDCLAMPTILYDKIESDVAELFLQLNIRSYPVDPLDIALRLGYELVPFSKMNKDARKILVPGDVDGISCFNPQQKVFIIYYQSETMKERMRFTIGHEIGHIRMNHKGESELARRIADYYAAYLLAPTPWIGCAECEDFTDVAKAFKVSNPCAMRCFERYEHWSRIPYIKEHEQKLLDLMETPQREVM